MHPVQLAWIAQLVERGTENPCVGGPIPSPGTTIKLTPCLSRLFLCLNYGILGGTQNSPKKYLYFQVDL